MKKIMLMLLVVLIPVVLYAVSVDEIINKSMEKRGGKSKLQGVKNWTIVGETKNLANGQSDITTLYFKDDKKFKVIVKNGKNEAVFASNGAKGWVKSEMYGAPTPTEMPENMHEMILQQFLTQKNLFIGPLHNYKEKNIKLKLTDNVKENKNDYYKLAVIDTSGAENNVFINKKTLLVDKIQAIGMGNKIEYVISNYKKVNDLILPHKLETFMNDKAMSILNFTKVDITSKIDDKIFIQPKN